MPAKGGPKKKSAPAAGGAADREPNCPRGLGYLRRVEELIIEQNVELVEAFIGYDTNNKFEIKNKMGQRMFIAAEESGCCDCIARNCCGRKRCYTLRVYDMYGTPIIDIHRGLRCESCFFPCCLQRLTVEAPPGTVVGYVRQSCTLFKPQFKINNVNDDTIMRANGPCVTCNICKDDATFTLTNESDDEIVGEIRRNMSGYSKDVMSGQDNFGVQFPGDLNVNTKAVILAAVFLMDFMYWGKVDEG